MSKRVLKLWIEPDLIVAFKTLKAQHGDSDKTLRYLVKKEIGEIPPVKQERTFY